ncbi:MAG: hypothetical protein AB7G13_08820 [Lautropia sp.]
MTAAREERIDSSGGVKIFVRSWPAEQFAARGLAVYASKLRSRGQFDGERFYLGHFYDLLADLVEEDVVADIAERIDARLR